MNWKNTFEVEAPPDEVFRTLLDIPTIAPCMPGATLTGQSDDGAYEGTVKVKLGPISAQYRGKARLQETDETGRRAVLVAEGSETRGQGTASATITAVCREAGPGTSVEIDTDLKLTGRVAQFGRGVLQDVSAKLIGQFADCLATTVLAGGGPSGTASATAEPTAETASADDATVTTGSDTNGKTNPPPPRPRPTSDTIDLGDVAGGAVAKRVVPAVIALVVLFLIWRAIRNRAD